MFKSLFGNGEKPAATTPIIYDCDPLVIADEADQIYFAGKIKVEFSPNETDSNQGVAILLDIEPEGWQPKLNVDKKLVEPAPFGASRFGRRGGFTWLGVDDDNTPFLWFIDRAADVYLTSRDSGNLVVQVEE